jgi:putative Na+/H+ antiporter
MKKRKIITLIVLLIIGILLPLLINASGMRGQPDMLFPLPLSAYQDSHIDSIGGVLLQRIKQQPMNLVVSLLFLCAIIHTFCVGFFKKIAEQLEEKYEQEGQENGVGKVIYNGQATKKICCWAEFFHLLSEVEIIFGMWVIPVFWMISFNFGWGVSLRYMTTVNFTEPIFVVVIMTLASSRPIEQFSENCMRVAAKIGKGSTAAWWFAVLTIGPTLGSFITEPGAMTISAMLLAKYFYQKKPSLTFAYATIGLLFVNVSVGGTLSHFAAPPVLMVAGKWGWDTAFMLSHFGWKAVTGIVISNIIYFTLFRSEFRRMDLNPSDQTESNESRSDPIPKVIILIHILFVTWTVFCSHYPVLFVPGFFIFLGFRQSTAHYQNETHIKPPLLVGAFLAGLVVHGGLQAWWIAPILGGLGEITLMLGATFLTAFNDNAAIAYLSTMVPTLTESMKFAVIAGAVTGGGLTVIANAPNPAGISILRGFFKYGVSPAKLALGALLPTIIMGLSFMLLP